MLVPGVCFSGKLDLNEKKKHFGPRGCLKLRIPRYNHAITYSLKCFYRIRYGCYLIKGNIFLYNTEMLNQTKTYGILRSNQVRVTITQFLTFDTAIKATNSKRTTCPLSVSNDVSKRMEIFDFDVTAYFVLGTSIRAEFVAVSNQCRLFAFAL